MSGSVVDTFPPRKKFSVKFPFSRRETDPGIDFEKLPKSGETLQLEGFGGVVELTDGEGATLRNLVDISVSGVIIFSFPKANTPGCTAQACFFRECYHELRATGYAVYGLSRDTLRANQSFKIKNNLPFTLICDQQGTLIQALGFHKPPKSTARGVIVIEKDGKVLASLAGSPNATVRAVLDLVDTTTVYEPGASPETTKEDVEELQNWSHGTTRSDNLKKQAVCSGTVGT